MLRLLIANLEVLEGKNIANLEKDKKKREKLNL